ncbi:hypothetical protein GQ53DRAFT_751993 [Thozetella sp. PMI_491]|nr:hypothetical protein GQ53DRAFT_751993 [Thozetella sp. PMI_491]
MEGVACWAFAGSGALLLGLRASLCWTPRTALAMVTVEEELPSTRRNSGGLASPISPSECFVGLAARQCRRGGKGYCANRDRVGGR